MANPRKFSEKIALQKQKQAEGTAEFEKIMNEVKATRVVDNVLGNTDITDGNGLHRNASLSGGSGGSGTSSGASGGGASPDANAGGGGSIGGGGGGGGSVGIVNTTSGSPTYRESRGRSVGVGPMRRPSERKQDRSPYGSTAGGLMLSGMTQQTQNSYLSPPMDSSWRRSNSDSALHQTLNNLAEGNFGTSSPAPSVMGDLNSLHANYHHHHHPHHSQRSQSPNIGRSYSPQAQRRKNTLLQQQQHQQQLHHQQQQQQLQHQRLQMQQQQQQAQQQQHQQLQQHLQSQQQSLQQQQQHLHHQQQQQQYANAKYNNSNIMFKSLHDQQLSFNNTGSLPDLTSVHYSTPNPNNSSTQMMQTTTTSTQQQQTLSPILSPHHNNGCHDRDQSPSPFSPASTAGGGNSGGGPPSPYHQQQNSPTSAANTPTANVQTSPHLSFTNLSVQSPVNVQQTTAQNTAAAFSTLPTLGATSSTGNLTDYRQPMNPPSPGSSPGLLTSGPANDIHTSAPPSPIRHCQNNLNTPVSGGNSSQNQQTQMPTQSLQNTFGNLDTNTGYNTLNPAFHNHFEQFHLGDNSQSPQNNYDDLEFEGLVMGNQQHNTFNSKIIDFGDLTTPSSATSSNTTRTNSTNTTSNCNNNNNLPQQQPRNNSQQFQHHHQQLLNNNSTTSTTSSNANTNGPSNTCRTHNTGLMNNNDRQQDILSANSSPIPSPLSHCVPPPSSPLPIPMSAHSPSHHQQQQQQQLSLSVQTSPHHSPMHSPHHSPSPLSVSSPGLTMLGGSVSPVPSPSAHIIQQHQQQQQQQQQHQHNHINNQTANQLHHNQTSHNNHHHHHQQPNQTHTPTTTTNIPQIIFSDYSSSRDIFDSLDLDLGTIDGQGLQMLSDQNPIMIADPSIEDSFRRDLN